MQEVKIYGGDYGVTDDGRVISYKKRTAEGIPIPQELRGGLTTRNRRYRTVLIEIDGLFQSKYVHRLVAEAFVPNPNNYNEVNHKDGDTYNNREENLEWVTHRENIQHAYDTGLVKKTTCSICGKTGYLRKTVCKECQNAILLLALQEQKAETLARDLERVDPQYREKHRRIFDLRASGAPITEIARECGCSKQNVSNILRRGLAMAALSTRKEELSSGKGL